MDPDTETFGEPVSLPSKQGMGPSTDEFEELPSPRSTSARISSGNTKNFFIKMGWFYLSAPTHIKSFITMNGDRYNSEVAMVIERSICSSHVTEVAAVSPIILADVRRERVCKYVECMFCIVGIVP